MRYKQIEFRAKLVAFFGCVCLVSSAVAHYRIQTETPIVIRKSGGVLEGSALKRAKPSYPALAKAAQVSGVVVVEVTIGEDGLVLTAKALSGHPLLKDAAVSAARLWRFSPTLLGGKPVKVIGTLTFNFRSDDSATKDGEQEIKDAKAAVDAHPGSAEARFDLGEAYTEAERHEEAIESFKQAIQLKPDYEQAHSAIAGVYQELGRYDDEIRAYQNALAVIPNSTECLSSLARALGDRGRFSEAIEIQKRLIELRPKDARVLGMLGWLLHNAHRYDEAVDALKEAIALLPNDARTHFNLGAAYLRLGRFEQALGAYQQSLEVKPPFDRPGRAHLEISLVLTRLGRASDSIEAARKAIESEPTLIDAYCTLASAYSNSRRYQEALDIITAGLQVKPLDETLQVLLGNVCLKIGNLAGAEKAYRDSLRGNPTSPNGHIGLATALSRQNKFSEAETVLRNAVALSPMNTNGLVLLGNVLGEQGRKAEAEKEFRRALEIEPNNPLVLNNLGYSMVERGENLEEALKMIQRALDSAPGKGEYLDSLGLAYFKLGRLSEAEAPLLEAARQFPSSSTVHEHLGDVYAGQGKPDHARAAWQKALSLSTGADEAARLRSKLTGETKK